MTEQFKAHHMNAAPEDFEGNQGVGRYVLIPGSDGRAKRIAEQFVNRSEKTHSRGHNLYMGQLECAKGLIDVATISSGMGCPSIDLIATELIHLGAKRLLRVGTAGSMQPTRVPIGDCVIANAAVRDDGTTTAYFPIEVPALASFEMINSATRAAEKLGMKDKVHVGPVHTKSSLYAREINYGPLAAENKRYKEILKSIGIYASEMEAAQLFVLGSYYDQELAKDNHKDPRYRVYTGAILAIIGDDVMAIMDKKGVEKVTATAIELSLETIRELAMEELRW